MTLQCVFGTAINTGIHITGSGTAGLTFPYADCSTIRGTYHILYACAVYELTMPRSCKHSSMHATPPLEYVRFGTYPSFGRPIAHTKHPPPKKGTLESHRDSASPWDPEPSSDNHAHRLRAKILTPSLESEPGIVSHRRIGSFCDSLQRSIPCFTAADFELSLRYRPKIREVSG